jgi:hypothetical protein
MAVESGYDFPASGALPASVKQLIAKYRKLYLDKGLTGVSGSSTTPAVRPVNKFHVLERSTGRSRRTWTSWTSRPDDRLVGVHR